LNAGKGLYIENGDLGYYHSSTTLYQMLGCTYVGDGYPSSTGNVSHLTGQGGSFVAGMEYDFPYQQPCDNYIDQISANGGTLLFRSQDNHGRVVAYTGSGSDYRSIHASYVFGAQPNGSHTKDQLMALYMNFLTQTIGIEEMNEVAIHSVSLAPNPARHEVNIRFTLNHSMDVSVQVYNIAGQNLRTLIDEHLNAGMHTISWDGHDDNGSALSSGTYIIRVCTDDIVISRTVVLVK